MKPIIGITSNFSNDDLYFVKQGLGAREQTWSMIANDYSEAIIDAGGIPVVIPISENKEYIEDFAKILDGLLLTGGADIGPNMANQRSSAKVGLISYERDMQEWDIIDYIYNKTNIPILGICRGMQYLNIYFGGNTILDLPSEGYLDHGILGNKKFVPAHEVNVKEDSLLCEMVNSDVLYVNSLHHQGVNKLGKDLNIAAISEDNVVEALEHINARERFIMGVQWHPEMLISKDSSHKEFFKKLISESSKNK